MTSAGFDRLTRQFCDRFQAEREAFLGCLQGVPERVRQPCGSTLLNRLIFLYFLQGKGLLDGDPAYLRNRLARSRDAEADGFYDRFLDPLLRKGVGVREASGEAVRIPDAAFCRLFAFFDRYRWRLGGGYARAPDEITPDILGHLLEKQISQREMGAYYTGEDVAEYLARATLVPCLLETTLRRCPDAFRGGHSPWRLLQEDPDRYLFASVRKGEGLPLPAGVGAGLQDVSWRGQWNRSAPPEQALPGETWREVVARRRWLQEVKAKLSAGKVRSVDDLIALNLDLGRFAHDLLDRSEGPDLSRAFLQALGEIRVLDPTCGAGAFLLAALHVLEPLYDACLERSEGLPHTGRSLLLARMVKDNLHGLDLMEEAVETCRLRLGLELAARLDGPGELERLDLDFNFRAGNLLQGGHFGDGHPDAPAPAELSGGADRGGFDVVIGNPPYLELSEVAGQYPIRGLPLAGTGNLYSVCLERFAALLRPRGRMGVIVPISAVSTPRMQPLRRLLLRQFSPLHLANFAVRPARLFAGVDMNISLLVGQKAGGEPPATVYSTGYNRWPAQFRPHLFAALRYARAEPWQPDGPLPKVGSEMEAGILRKALQCGGLARFRSEGPDAERVYYHSGGRYFRKCLRQKLSNEYRELRLQSGWGDAAICLLSSSFYYWFWIATSDCYHVTARDVDVLPVPESLGGDARVHELAQALLDDLWRNAEFRTRNRADGSRQREVDFRVGMSRAILDRIDCLLARHYGWTEEELDLIINYDAKYRSGA